MTENELVPSTDSRTCSWQNWLQWVPTSMKALEEAESKILSYLNTAYRTYYVNIGTKLGDEPKRIWTISMNETKPNTPLVLVHGFGSGVALWALNLDALASSRPVYAFDILGFGRSSRPVFSTDPVEAENQLVESMEDWRKEVGLKDFILLGHSMGGYLASAYAMSHPEHVKHLILADPWGFQEKPADQDRPVRIPLWAKAIGAILQPFNPFAGLRAAGPLGPSLVDRLRPDLKRKFLSLIEEDDIGAIPNYIYHCNAQTPSGETAFKTLTSGFGWAKHPMGTRIGKSVRSDIRITFLYGQKSWIDRKSGYVIKNQREDSTVDIQIIQGAGHHIYADQVEEFNELVQSVCNNVDDNLNNQQSCNATSDHKNSPQLSPKPNDNTECLGVSS